MDADVSASFDAFAVVSLPRLRRLAYGWCRDVHRAEDLAQGALERVFAAWPRVRRMDNPFAYARTTMMRLLLSEQRRPWFRRERTTADVPERQVPTTDTEARMDLLTAVHALPPRQRAVVLLRFIEDLPVAEVAAVLGCSEGNVKSLTHVATATLRRRYTANLTTGTK